MSDLQDDDEFCFPPLFTTVLGCVECGRPVKAWGHGRKNVKSPGPDHDLCQRCWQATQDRHRMSGYDTMQERDMDRPDLIERLEIR